MTIFGLVLGFSLILTCTSQPEAVVTEQEFQSVLDRLRLLEANEQVLLREIQSLKASNLNLEAKLKNKQDITPLISFRAGFTHDPVPIKYSNGQTVVFNRVYLNDGNAYTDHSGIFRAPVSGLYMFTLHVLPTFGAMSFVIRKDNGTVGHMEAMATGGTESMQIPLHVGKNQEVWVVKVWGDGHVIRGSMLSTFSGYLLRIDDDSSHNQNGGSLVG